MRSPLWSSFLRAPGVPLLALSLAATLPARSDAATYTWAVGHGSWATASNWTPARTTPAADDRLVFQTGTTINVNSVPTTTIGQLAVLNGTQIQLIPISSPGNTLTIGGGAGADLDVPAGSAVTLGGNANRLVVQLTSGSTAAIGGVFQVLSGTHRLQAVDAGAIVFAPGSSARPLNGLTGNMFGPGNASSAAASVIFQAGSTYQQNTSADDPFGTAVDPVVVFEPGSLYRFGSNSIVVVNGRTFANVEVGAGPGGIAELRGTVGCTMDSLIVTSGTFSMLHTAETVIRGHLRLVSGARLKVGPLSGTGSLRFAGSVEQWIDGAQEFPNQPIPGFIFQPNLTVVIDNPAGVRFPGDDYPTAPLDMGPVQLVRGVFHLDNFTALRLRHPVTGGSVDSWIHARVHRYLPTAFEVETIPVGTATEYTPITLLLEAALTDTTIVSALVQSPGDPPMSPLTDASFFGAQIDTTKRVNLQYHLSFFDELTTVPPPRFAVELGFRPANLGPGADPMKFVPRLRCIGAGGDTNQSWRPHYGLLGRGPSSTGLLGIEGDHPSDYAFVFALGEPSVVNLTVQDPAVEEGGEALRTDTHADGSTGMTFGVSLSEPAVETITVDYATSSGTAQSGTDFTPGQGTLTFLPGDTVKFVVVPILGEGDAENHETLSLVLSNATGAVIADGEGEGTILDDDDVTPPVATVVSPNGGETVIEGSTVNLEWTANDDVVVQSVDLLLSKDGGGTWESIAADLPNTGTYAWQAPVGLTQQALLRVVAADHRSQTGEDVSDAVWSIWGVDGVEPVVPTRFAFDVASANPTVGTMQFRLALTRDQAVRMLVHDVRGRLVEVPVDERRPAGAHTLEWSGRSARAGVYFVTLQSEEGSAVRRVVRLR